MKGHIRKRGKSSWSIVVELEPGPDGKRRQKWETVQGLKKKAEDRLAEILHSMNIGTYVEPAKLTVKQYLSDWLNEVAKNRVAGKTWERYKAIIDHHLIPSFGELPLQKLTPSKIQSAWAQELIKGRIGQEGGLSPQTVLHHHRLLHLAMDKALKLQLIARNPTDAVDPPRPRPKEQSVLDEAQSAWLIDAAVGTRLHLPILFAITTGLRRGEILALRWRDVDLETAYLTVNRAIEETKKAVTFKEPKSRKGRRMVSMPPILIDHLKAHRLEQEARKRLLGGAYHEGDLVCCVEDGSLWKPAAFTSAYRALLKRRKIANIPFHSLRHSHASQLLRAGISPKVISERLGHAKVGFTLDVYSHLLPGMQEEAAQKVDAALKLAFEKQRRVVS